MIKSKRSNMRDAIKAFLQTRGLKPHQVAKKAGIASSTLYNFLKGDSESLSAGVLRKIADTQSVTVDELLGGAAVQQRVELQFTIGIYGKMFQSEKIKLVARPAGVASDVRLVAAEVKGSGMMPFTDGWRVFFNEQPESPESLIGRLCVVRVVGADQPMVREIRRGSQPGLYNLTIWNDAPIEDAEVSAAHRVVSLAQPPHPE